MKEKVNTDIKALGLLLSELQYQCIGVFKPTSRLPYELVIDESKSFFTTIHVGSLFGLTTTYYEKSKDKSFMRFPDGVTLGKLMEKPFELKEYFDNTYVPNSYNHE